MKKLTQLNHTIMWDDIICRLKQIKPENTNFWDFVLHINSFERLEIFKDTEEYYNFLATFWYELNPKSLSSIQIRSLYAKLWRSFSYDENLIFFFAAIKPIVFDYFQIMMEKHKFLFNDVKKLTEEEFKFFDKFWTALFLQDLETSFLNKHYYYFLNNRDYFYLKVSTHKKFFDLHPAMINKFKNYKVKN